MTLTQELKDDSENKFVEKADLDKEKSNHKIGEVYVLDKSLVSKFHDNDDYKNALIHVLIKKAKNYFKSGLIVPAKYIEIAKDVCEENDKFKNFFDNHFDITNNENDKITKDELRDMYNHHTKCNFSASSIMTDIQRLQLKYEKGLRSVYNGISIRGIIVGIKKKTVHYEEDICEENNESMQPINYCQKLQDDEPYKTKYMQLEKDLAELNLGYEKELTELKLENEKLRLEFETYKKGQTKKSTTIFIDVSDEEEEEEEEAVVKPKTKTDKRNKIHKALTK